MKKCLYVSIAVFGVAALLSFTQQESGSSIAEVSISAKATAVADTAKTAPVAAAKEVKLKPYKKNVLATYYADKFNGRKTSSGERFDNKKYTAAHMKLPFGTMVRVTNEANGKWVDVKVNDRGPYNKKLEIDLTKKAFMEIASNKSSGTFKVKIEIIETK
ncbi:septal ring lytic transglycosylase RlpA family protein [Flavobacterium sp. D11R37]|uniref:septal ring lytic transglycosylase RlpA family protein n=1 Tax=Flavobacterium coralii TaxID=2838017 RepID=UPI001CA6AAE5|nr:septal ring lytic transglycosylase RlpA family protein [Flavobacterium coralii]MBY8963822.1 septal ring lytic transglycosylase RlpA family protein [Flavobacterium coralii]